MRRVIRLAVFMTYFLAAGNAFASTHYIAANGLDSNAGTTTGAPWKHAPGMLACSLSCAAYTPVAGDQFIFRGGDTWNFVDFGPCTQGPNNDTCWLWIWSGTSSSHIYIGVDQTFFSGASWVRPILNGNGNNFATLKWINISARFVDFDNFELTGLAQNGASGSGHALMIDYSGTDITVENSYFHGWSHVSCASQGGCPPMNDNITIARGDSHSPTQCQGCQFIYNVVDGTDSTNGGDSGAAVVYGPAIVHHNYIKNVSNGLETMGTDVHDNTIGPMKNSFDPNQHPNSIEQLGSTASGAGQYYYNNLLLGAVAVNFWQIPNAGVTSYVFNNVFVNTDAGNVFAICGSPSISASCGTINTFNNTIECGPDSNPNVLCIGDSSSSTPPAILSVLNSNNEHLITSGTAYSCLNVTSCNTGPNDVVQTKAVANGQGYALSGNFQPTSGSGATVGAGANLTSTYCTSMIAAQSGYGDVNAAKAACQKDTTLGVGYNTSNHAVIVANRTPNPRPSTGAWDVGAYEHTGGTARPNPPTNLRAVVN